MATKKLTRSEKIKISEWNKKLRQQLQQAKANKTEGVVLTVLGFAFILLLGYMWLHRHDEITPEELAVVEGVLAEKPAVEWKHKQGYRLIMQLREYPKINFRVSSFGIKSMDAWSLESRLNALSSIQLDILKTDLDRIDQPPGKKRNIIVYGIRDSEYEYLHVSAHNRAYKSDRNSIALYLMMGFSVWSFGYGIFILRRNKA